MRLPSTRIVVGLAGGAFVALALLGAVGALRDEDRSQAPPGASTGRWNIDMVGAADAWAVTRGTGITVAVIDVGVDTHHPDLRDRVVGGADCVGADGDPAACTPLRGTADADGHGTHVAGIVAASVDRRRGVAGVAPGVELLGVRALVPGSCDRRPCGGDGRGADVAAAVRWAVTEGAQVINLSLRSGPGGSDPDLDAAVEEAWASGVIVVVAGPDRSGLPPLGPVPAIVVTAVDAEGRLAPYAAGVGAARWGIAAPGGAERAGTHDGCRGDDAVRSTLPAPAGTNHAEGCLVGTSMAAPHVAGAAALLRAEGLSPRQTVDRLLATARDLGLPGPDATFGAGLLDVEAAVADR